MKRSIFPFPAVLGQERVKNALIWNFINPRIGGVLISGQKGTAKSTLIRGSEKISGRKLVELPLNITEDRLIGAIDFEHAVKKGEKRLEKGLLSLAHNNILYADEVNLLSDNVVKALLEAAGEGICRVEREGISAEYPCDFILVGSMNPEESGLRPQFLDRFGLYVDTVGEESPLIRGEIVRRRLEFEENPEAFIQKYQQEEEQLAAHIADARERLKQIEVSDSAMLLAAQLAQQVHCQGSRGELAVIETAKAIAAWKGAAAVNKEAITEAAKYALPHRAQALPPPQQKSQEEPQQEEQKESLENRENNQSQEDFPEGNNQQPEESSQKDSSEEHSNQDIPPKQQESPDKVDEAGAEFQVGKWLEEKKKITIHRGSGRRSLVKTDSLQGRYVKSTMSRRDCGDIAFDATLRAAAPYQKSRNKKGRAIAIEPSDIRTKVREKRTGNFIVFVVDASGSMGVGKRMSAVKGAILSLLSDAYQKRDRVAMITFRRDKAELVLGMTRSVDLAAKKLTKIATGGRTPLYAGIEAAHNLVKAVQQKEKDLLPVVVLVSDGRATQGKGKNAFQDAVKAGQSLTADYIRTVIIDVEQDFIKLRLAEKLGREMKADVYKLDELKAGAIVSAVNLASGR